MNSLHVKHHLDQASKMEFYHLTIENKFLFGWKDMIQKNNSEWH